MTLEYSNARGVERRTLLRKRESFEQNIILSELEVPTPLVRTFVCNSNAVTFERTCCDSSSSSTRYVQCAYYTPYTLAEQLLLLSERTGKRSERVARAGKRCIRPVQSQQRTNGRKQKPLALETRRRP